MLQLIYQIERGRYSMIIEVFPNGEKITNKDWKIIDELVEKLELTLDEAIQTRAFDKFESDKQTNEEKEIKEKNKKPQAKKITDEEINNLFQVVRENLEGKEFKNKDFHMLVHDKYTNRQTPSRLKKMVENGYLEDLGGTPKSYKIKK